MKGCFAEGQGGLWLGLETEGLSLGLDTILISRRFGNSGFTRSVGLLDLCITLRQGGGDISLFADLDDLRATHVGNVIVLITYIFNRERDDFQAHLFHIRRDGLKHFRTDVFWIFDQFFNRQLAYDTTQVTFHHQADQVLTLFLAFAEELFSSGYNARSI